MIDFQMPKVRLGTHGLEVSKLGYDCMGLTSMYNSLVPKEDGIAIIKYAFSKGITFFDTQDIYGADNANEILVGKLQNLELSKWKVVVKGTVEYVHSYCEASLKRLGVDYIDLYYIHRIDTSVPIEETMGELKKLVEEGKIKYIGLSEASPNTIRRAHVVHPITTLQMEYFLLTRDIEEEIIPLCRELGIVIFPYSPTAHGFFVGKAVVESVPTDSFLLALPRFTGQNLDHNKIFYLRIDELSKKHSCTPVQLALAWVIHQGDDTLYLTSHCTFAGTTKIKNLDENIGALRVKLTEDDLKEISDAVPILEIMWPRIYKSFTRVSFIFADPPLPKNSK
ncbi:putative aldo-keto reductase 1 [Camellia lanceoleosa]|uniref:Aldo-keto reductase 1 n=1 Tax=Camellia lanceoleosa TaxID=1840588 RepID=A0ACC0I925_9ERIC|nr:putative aldo-keto reductase 1 [Camellia lanceoleosa]